MTREIFVFGNNVCGAVDPVAGADKIIFEPRRLDNIKQVTWASWTSAAGIEIMWGTGAQEQGAGKPVTGYDEVHGRSQADGSVSSAAGVSSLKGWMDVTILGTHEVYALTQAPTTLHHFDSFQSFINATSLPPAIPFPALPNLDALVLHPGPSNLILQHPFGIWACGDTRHGITCAEATGGAYQHVPSQLEHLEGLKISCIALGGLRAAAVSDAGEAFIWGKAIEGVQPIELTLDDEEEERDINFVALGSEHEVVVTEENEVWVRGSNKHGQLGLGENVASSETYVRHPFFAALPKGFEVKAVKASRWATYITVDIP